MRAHLFLLALILAFTPALHAQDDPKSGSRSLTQKQYCDEFEAIARQYIDTLSTEDEKTVKTALKADIAGMLLQHTANLTQDALEDIASKFAKSQVPSKEGRTPEALELYRLKVLQAVELALLIPITYPQDRPAQVAQVDAFIKDLQARSQSLTLKPENHEAFWKIFAPAFRAELIGGIDYLNKPFLKKPWPQELHDKLTQEVINSINSENKDGHLDRLFTPSRPANARKSIVENMARMALNPVIAITMADQFEKDPKYKQWANEIDSKVKTLRTKNQETISALQKRIRQLESQNASPATQPAQAD